MPALEEETSESKKSEYHQKFTGYNRGSNGNSFELERIGFKFNIDGTLKGFIKYKSDFKKQRCAFQGEWKDNDSVSFTYSIMYDDGPMSYRHTAKLKGSVIKGERFSIEGDYVRTDGGSKGTFNYTPFVLDPDYKDYESAVETAEYYRYQYAGHHKNSAGSIFPLEYVCLTFLKNYNLKGIIHYTSDFAGTKRCQLDGSWNEEGNVNFSYSLQMNDGSKYTYEFSGKALGKITSAKRFRIEGNYSRTDGGSKGTWLYSPYEYDAGFSD